MIFLGFLQFMFIYALFVGPMILFSVLFSDNDENNKNQTSPLEKKKKEPESELMTIKKKLLTLINSQGDRRFLLHEWWGISIASIVLGI